AVRYRLGVQEGARLLARADGLHESGLRRPVRGEQGAADLQAAVHVQGELVRELVARDRDGGAERRERTTYWASAARLRGGRTHAPGAGSDVGKREAPPLVGRRHRRDRVALVDLEHDPDAVPGRGEPELEPGNGLSSVLDGGAGQGAAGADPPGDV